MANIVVNQNTALPGEEVIVRSIQFFSVEQWRIQSQSSRIATFVGRAKIPWGLLILVIIGLFFFIIPGIILYFFLLRRVLYQSRTIVLTVTPLPSGTEIMITYPVHAKQIVGRFLAAMPKSDTAIAASS